MQLKRLVYKGPIKGMIRFRFKNNLVRGLYKQMLKEVNSRACMEQQFQDSENKEDWFVRYFQDCDLEKAIGEVNDAYEHNKLGMYLFVNWKQHLIGFGFRDMQMRDFGYGELVG